jgi:hypothetical protein
MEYARICTVLLLLAHVASAQDDTKKKKADVRHVDIQVKVSTSDGKTLPAGATVEVSAQEEHCGTLNAKDITQTLDVNGLATFRDLPVCRVSVKVNLRQYLPVRKVVDLSTSCTSSICDVIALMLDPLA